MKKIQTKKGPKNYISSLVKQSKIPYQSSFQIQGHKSPTNINTLSHTLQKRQSINFTQVIESIPIQKSNKKKVVKQQIERGRVVRDYISSPLNQKEIPQLMNIQSLKISPQTKMRDNNMLTIPIRNEQVDVYQSRRKIGLNNELISNTSNIVRTKSRSVTRGFRESRSTSQAIRHRRLKDAILKQTCEQENQFKRVLEKKKKILKFDKKYSQLVDKLSQEYSIEQSLGEA